MMLAQCSGFASILSRPGRCFFVQKQYFQIPDTNHNQTHLLYHRSSCHSCLCDQNSFSSMSMACLAAECAKSIIPCQRLDWFHRSSSTIAWFGANLIDLRQNFYLKLFIRSGIRSQK